MEALEFFVYGFVCCGLLFTLLEFMKSVENDFAAKIVDDFMEEYEEAMAKERDKR